MSDKIRVVPKSAIIRALCNQPLMVRTALCEWIDNSLDAGAKMVSVTFGAAKQGLPAFIAVEDDGVGKADLTSFAVLGCHERSRNTRSGTFGVGAKDAALYFGGENSVFTVSSVHGGKSRRFEINWGAMVTNDWELEAPTEVDAEIAQSTGTKVVVAPVIRRVPDGDAWERLIDDLSYTYTPAIKRGVQIKIQSKRRGAEPEILTAWRLPSLQPGIVDVRIEVGGKRARVYAGIVSEGERNLRAGLTYLHGFRVISMASALGCGGYSVARIAGFVEIDDSWSRNKNKDGIQNAEALYEEVERTLEDLLRRAEQQGSQLRSAAFTRAVEGVINASLDDAKAKRERGSEKGTVSPKGSARRHRDAAKKQRGSTMPSRRFGAVKLDFDHLGVAQGIGKIQANGVVVLNLDNPAIAKAKATDNVLATACSACALVASDRAIRGDDATLSLRLPHARDDADAMETFSTTLGDLLSSQAELDGSAILGAEAAE